MAVEDWAVVVLDVAPHANTNQNPYTGLPIDPIGLTQSLVTMTLTHGPSGQTIDRADVFSVPSADAIQRYALGVIMVAEANLTQQTRGATPSPLQGALQVVPSAPVDPRTPEQQALDAAVADYQQATSVYTQQLALIDAWKLAAPDKAADLDTSLAKAKAVRDAAAATAADAFIAVDKAVQVNPIDPINPVNPGKK